MSVPNDHAMQPPLRPFDLHDPEAGPWAVQYWKNTDCQHLGAGGPHVFFYRVRTGIIRQGNYVAEHRQREAMYAWCMQNLGSSDPPKWACDESMARGADRMETIFYFVDERDAVLFKLMCC